MKEVLKGRVRGEPADRVGLQEARFADPIVPNKELD